MAVDGSSIGPYFIVSLMVRSALAICSLKLLVVLSSSAGTNTAAAVQKRVSTFPSIWKLEQGEAAARHSSDSNSRTQCS